MMRKKIRSHGQNFYLGKSNKKGFQFLWPRGLIFGIFFSNNRVDQCNVIKVFFELFLLIHLQATIHLQMNVSSFISQLESVEKLRLRVQLVRCKLSHSDDFGAGPTPENLESAAALASELLHDGLFMSLSLVVYEFIC